MEWHMQRPTPYFYMDLVALDAVEDARKKPDET